MLLFLGRCAFTAVCMYAVHVFERDLEKKYGNKTDERQTKEADEKS